MCNYVAYNRFYKLRFLHLFTSIDDVTSDHVQSTNLDESRE